MAEIGLQEYVQEIEGAVDQGRYDEAVAHGRHILQYYPKCLSVYRVLGKAMLEAGQDALAEDMFRRVLSGDPEDFVARVGMSVICDRQGDLQRAIWHLERAFDLRPENEAVREELRRLYARRDGVEPARVQLTREALARLYRRGNLLSRAIQEFRAILAGEPGRMDVWVALAEALWSDEQRVQAEEACLRVLDELPYCLRANLILGEIWSRSGRDEGRVHLQRAEALDPENRLAVMLLGEVSPLEPREVRLPHLEYVPPPTGAERPAWRPVPAAAEAPAEERALVDLEAAMEARIEIPAWLEEIGLAGGEEAPTVETEGIAVPEWLLEQSVEMAEGPLPEAREAEEETPPAPVAAEEVPSWLREASQAEPVERAEVPEAAPAEAVPEWLGEIGPAEGEEPLPEVSEEMPEWLRQVSPWEGTEVSAGVSLAGAPGWPEEVPLPEAEEGAAEELAPAEIPDWLLQMAPPEVRQPPGPADMGLEETAAEEAAEPLVEALPEWLTELPEPEVGEQPVPGGAAAAEQGGLPAWLEGEGLPSGDEALAWLESLAAGKEEELRAATEAEVEARMAEIMGRPRETVPTESFPAPEAAPGPGVEEEALPGPVELPEWLTELGAPEMAHEAAGGEPAPETSPPEGPEWLTGFEVPELLQEPEPPEVPRAEVSPAEAEVFGFTAFGAQEAQPPPAGEAIAVEQGFGWTGFEPEAPATPEEPLGPAAAGPEALAPELEYPSLGIPAEAPGFVAEAVGKEERQVLPVGEQLEGLREQVRLNPRDYDAQLALARMLWQSGQRGDSLELYSRLLRANKQVEQVVEDMEAHAHECPHDSVVSRVLGDAYMRAGRLAQALEIYREALEHL